MAKKKDVRKETKSEFLRKALGENPNLDHRHVNLRWVKSGHPGEISNALFYHVRAELEIKTEWIWVKESEPELTLIAASVPAGKGAAKPTASLPVQTTSDVYQLKITLEDIQPPIWRRIQVPDCSLGELHETLQVVMGWQNSHLHQFIIEGEYYGPRDPDEMDWEMETDDEEEVLLSQVAKMGRKVRFTYEYDFGDSWQHEILLEQTMVPEPKINYPRCIQGARACPPEDCGGTWGYSDFLEAIRDPKHENHRDMKTWIVGKFDPDKFSAEALNKELRRYSRG